MKLLNKRQLQLSNVLSKHLTPMVYNFLKRYKLLVTISNIELSPDLRYAQIYIYCTGDENRTDTIELLNNEINSFKKSLASSLKTRFIPDLIFRYDQDLEKQLHISELIADSIHE